MPLRRRGRKRGDAFARGEDCHASKLTEVQAVEIKRLCRETTLTYREIAERVKSEMDVEISAQTVSNIARGITWSHIQ